MKKCFLSSTYHLDGVLVGTGLTEAQKLALIFSGSKITRLSVHLHSFFLHLFFFNKELSATKQGVCHTVALPFTLKISQGKRRILEIQIFHYAKI
jgi:hypothetical protein